VGGGLRTLLPASLADGPVMPYLVTVNPCITTMMIGEKCVDLIKANA
jgi:choline dehydrogenase